MARKERILVLCAHADDEIIAMGGTLAKYAKERKNVKIVIFSSGEKSVPWLKEKVITKKRVRESEEVSKILGFKVEFLGLPDMKLASNLKENSKIVQKIIMEFKPDKIFTHSKYDVHSDHKAVFNALEMALHGKKRKPKIFTFIIWGFINPKDSVTFNVNIDDFFEDKIKALRTFKTQRVVVALFYLPIYIKARVAGYKNGCRYAEAFYVENA